MKIEIGSGTRPHKGYTTIDIRGEVEPEYIGDFRDMEFEDVREVRSHHLLEHFSREDGIEALRIWHSWLRPGGLLVIETPDIEGICERFKEDPYRMATHLYGTQHYPNDYHKDGWWRGKFEDILPKIGFRFKSIKRFPGKKGGLPNIMIVAKKLK